jgi:hypothetical protein
MRLPSDADHDAMRARGLEAESIKQDIRSAFAGVRLGDGIGLFEAQGIDDFADPATCARYREDDEKDDWTAIAVEDLNRCYSSLSFFDAAGMRFHLPAYLIADLDGAFLQDLDFTLTMTSRMDEQFALLDPAQRAAVRRYLEFIADDPDGRFGRDQILLALAGYWAA